MQIFEKNSLGVCVFKICSNGGATYIIGEIIAKKSLKIANLKHSKKYSSHKQLNRILKY